MLFVIYFSFRCQSTSFWAWRSPVRVSRDQARQNRKRVVETSSTLFREKGVDGVGISDIMGEAGLTHGGFYKQFSSKAELVEEACALALDDTMAFWDSYLEGAAKPRDAFVRAYLSQQHCNRVGEGCLLPALAAEARREPQAIRSVFTRAIRAYTDRLDQSDGAPTPQSRAEALSTLSEMVGAILLARVSDDPELSQEILAAARHNITGD
ncbi:MAG: TetR/AcrR family transcriptional regulator [Phenylobacterium sp.]|uniref:TetR/AcrR family transcriptional regulator n=1 Tax=Phenylobacterium sp. TaxID=1871053 RepID=UPI003BB6D4B6